MLRNIRHAQTRTRKTVSAHRTPTAAAAAAAAAASDATPLTDADAIAAAAWSDAHRNAGNDDDNGRVFVYASAVCDLLEGANDKFADEVADWLDAIEHAEGRTAVYAIVDEAITVLHRFRQLPILLRIAVLGTIMRDRHQP